jgi:hypothetical protein
VFVGGALVLFTLFVLLLHSGVQLILCFCFICLRLVYPVFPVSQIVQF